LQVVNVIDFQPHRNRSTMRSCAILVALLASLAAAASPLAPTNKLFGHAIKGATLPAATEVTTFQHNCTTAPCVITQIHVPSIYAPAGCESDWEHGRLRLYIDGESTPSIDVKLLEIASVSFNADIGTNPAQDGSPWGHDLFGKTANNGGVYSTFRVPFQSSIRSTIEAAPGCADASVYWFIIRGVEGMPVQLGEDFILPANAKLNIQRNVNVTLQVCLHFNRFSHFVFVSAQIVLLCSPWTTLPSQRCLPAKVVRCSTPSWTPYRLTTTSLKRVSVSTPMVLLPLNTSLLARRTTSYPPRTLMKISSRRPRRV
jgi:hypothetical protein